MIGASRDPEAWGHVLLRNLLNGGFRGRIYAVNPRANEVLGMRCHRSVFEVPEEVDLAVIALPSSLVYDAVVECGEKGAKYAIVVSAGFGESSRSDLERKVVQAARARGMRIIGPNCMGIYSSHSDLVSTFTSLVPPMGGDLVCIPKRRCRHDRPGLGKGTWRWVQQVREHWKRVRPLHP